MSRPNNRVAVVQTEDEKKYLEKIKRALTEEARKVTRAEIILLSA